MNVNQNWNNMQPQGAVVLPAEPQLTAEEVLLLQRERLPQNRDGLLQYWQRTCELLAKAKESEMAVRNRIGALYFPTPKEGMNNFDLGNGFTLKFGNKLNYSLDKNLVHAALDEIEKLGERGKLVAERLVKFQPDLSLTEYRILEDEYATSATAKQIKDKIDAVLSIKPGAPTLEIKEPKNK